MQHTASNNIPSVVCPLVPGTSSAWAGTSGKSGLLELSSKPNSDKKDQQ